MKSFAAMASDGEIRPTIKRDPKNHFNKENFGKIVERQEPVKS